MQQNKQHSRQTSCRCLLSTRDPDELRATMMHATIGAHLSATERYVSTRSREEIEQALITFALAATVPPPLLSSSQHYDSNLFVLQGSPGSGKSALVSHSIPTIRSSLPKGSLLLEHHIQPGCASSQPTIVCRRLASLIATKQNKNEHE